ncbi:MAG: cytochrome c [Acidobacteria bacterium]|nr:cytochrome c [Acidobacteriota bacterium]
MIEKYVDAKELKQLLSTLVAIVGCLIIAALFGILVVPGLRNANKPGTPAAVPAVLGRTGWLDPAEFPVRRGRLIPAVDPATLIDPSEELVQAGKNFYETNCLTCHGTEGRGDGAAAATINPKPRDFKAPDGWRNGREMPAIYKTLSEGIAGTSMGSYDYLNKKDRMALVHYVQSLGGYAGTEGSPESMQALSAELAAPGEKTNNRIPVSMAMAKLESEYAPPRWMTPLQGESRGAELLQRAVTDKERAARVLGASELWRAGPEALAGSILPGVPANGFSAGLTAWSRSEWRALYDELVSRIDAE